MRRVLVAVPLSFVLGCMASADDGPSPYDDDYPVSSYDPLFAGAPDDRSLPDENKADAIYPTQFSLAAEQSPVKSQGRRGVCSIFATVALMENLYIKAGHADADFSEQYMQWAAKRVIGAFTSTEGSNAVSNLRAASEHGIVDEGLWAYQPAPWSAADDAACTGGENLPVQCYTNGEPPAAAAAGVKHKLPRGRWLGTGSMKAHLTSKKSGVVVGLTFFYQAWNHRASTLPVNTGYWREGIVLAPNAADRAKSLEKRAGHAILIVGWDDEKTVPIVDETGAIVKDADGNPVVEKGFWIFKNSWGTGSFGAAHPDGDGYGYLSMKYVDEFGSAYVSDVPAVEPPPPPPPAGRTYAATPAAAIPDDDPAGIASTIAVTDAGTARSVKVTLDIRHSYRGDLVVVLAHGGRTITLHDRAGSYEDNLTLTVDVPTLAGLPLAGDWTLTVSDRARDDVGTLAAWSVDVVTN